MRKIIYKKASQKEVVGLVLLLIAVGLVFFLIYRIDVLSWIKALPHYTPAPEEEINVVDLGEDFLSKINCIPVAVVGEFHTSSLSSYMWNRNLKGKEYKTFQMVDKKIDEDGKVVYSSVDSLLYVLYYSKYSREGDYEIRYESRDENVLIATIEGNRLIVKQEILGKFDENENFLETDNIFKENYGESIENLLLIHNSYHLPNSYIFCKTNEQIEEYEKSIENKKNAIVYSIEDRISISTLEKGDFIKISDEPLIYKNDIYTIYLDYCLNNLENEPNSCRIEKILNKYRERINSFVLVPKNEK